MYEDTGSELLLEVLEVSAAGQPVQFYCSTLYCSRSSRRHEYRDGESAMGDGWRKRERESVLNEYLPSRSVSEWWVRDAWYNHLFCLPFAPPPARRLHQSRLSMTSHLALRFYTRLVSLSYYYFDSQKNGCVCITIFRFLLYLVSVVFIAVGISVWFDKWFYYGTFSPAFLSLRLRTIRQGTLNKGIQRTRVSSTNFSVHMYYLLCAYAGDGFRVHRNTLKTESEFECT